MSNIDVLVCLGVVGSNGGGWWMVDVGWVLFEAQIVFMPQKSTIQHAFPLHLGLRLRSWVNELNPRADTA